MIAKAQARYVRVSPRKVRAVIDLIRGKNALAALNILFNINKAAKHPVEKVLKSAMRNAEIKAPSVKTELIYISNITADQGPMLKRYRAATMGRATLVRKKTTHIIVELDVKPVKNVDTPKTKTMPAAKAKKGKK